MDSIHTQSDASTRATYETCIHKRNDTIPRLCAHTNTKHPTYPSDYYPPQSTGTDVEQTLVKILAVMLGNTHDARHMTALCEIWRRTQNRKYITYRVAARRGSSQGHSQHASTKFGEVRPCGFRVMPADRQTDRQTNRHTHHNNWHGRTAPGGKVTSETATSVATKMTLLQPRAMNWIQLTVLTD